MKDGDSATKSCIFGNVAWKVWIECVSGMWCERTPKGRKKRQRLRSVAISATKGAGDCSIADKFAFTSAIIRGSDLGGRAVVSILPETMSSRTPLSQWAG